MKYFAIYLYFLKIDSKPNSKNFDRSNSIYSVVRNRVHYRSGFILYSIYRFLVHVIYRAQYAGCIAHGLDISFTAFDILVDFLVVVSFEILVLPLRSV